MTDAERTTFLGGHRWGGLSTVNQEGEPHVAPVGYLHLDGDLYFHGLVDSRRGRDLEAGSFELLCGDDGVELAQGYSDRRGVIVYARCTRLTGSPARWWRAYAAAFSGGSGCVVRAAHACWYQPRPYRFARWDFGRIPDGADAHAKR